MCLHWHVTWLPVDVLSLVCHLVSCGCVCTGMSPGFLLMCLHWCAAWFPVDVFALVCCLASCRCVCTGMSRGFLWMCFYWCATWFPVGVFALVCCLASCGYVCTGVLPELLYFDVQSLWCHGQSFTLVWQGAMKGHWEQRGDVTNWTGESKWDQKLFLCSLGNMLYVLRLVCVCIFLCALFFLPLCSFFICFGSCGKREYFPPSLTFWLLIKVMGGWAKGHWGWFYTFDDSHIFPIHSINIAQLNVTAGYGACFLLCCLTRLLTAKASLSHIYNNTCLS